MLLEGEPTDSNKKHNKVSSSRASYKGLVLTSLNRTNWFVPLLMGCLSTFITAAIYTIFLRGFGLAKVGLLFGAGDSPNEAISRGASAPGHFNDVASLAQKSVVHTKSMISAARLNESGLWTCKSLLEPIKHSISLLIILPSLRYLVKHSWTGLPPPSGKVTMFLPLSIVSMLIGKGIPGLVAAAGIAFVGGLLQISLVN